MQYIIIIMRCFWLVCNVQLITCKRPNMRNIKLFVCAKLWSLPSSSLLFVMQLGYHASCASPTKGLNGWERGMKEGGVLLQLLKLIGLERAVSLGGHYHYGLPFLVAHFKYVSSKLAHLLLRDWQYFLSCAFQWPHDSFLVFRVLYGIEAHGSNSTANWHHHVRMVQWIRLAI